MHLSRPEMFRALSSLLLVCLWMAKSIRGDMLDLDIVYEDEVYFQVEHPEELKYTFRAARSSDFGTNFKSRLNKVALVPSRPFHCCSMPNNAEAMRGGVALVVRGECSFVTKAINAERAGALAVLVMDSDYSNDDYYVGMQDDQTGRPVNVPTAFLLGKDGFVIINVLNELHLDQAIINIPVNMTGVPLHKHNLPPWMAW